MEQIKQENDAVLQHKMFQSTSAGDQSSRPTVGVGFLQLLQIIPPSYTAKGDQEGIVRGAVEYVSKLENRLRVLKLQNHELQNLVPPFDTLQSSSCAGKIDVAVFGIEATINIITRRQPLVLTNATKTLEEMQLYVSAAYYAVSNSSEAALYRFHVSVIQKHALVKIEAAATTAKLSAVDIVVALRQMLVGLMDVEVTPEAEAEAIGLRSSCSVCMSQCEKAPYENTGVDISSLTPSLRQLYSLVMLPSQVLKRSIDVDSIVCAAAKYIRKLQCQVQVMEFQNRKLQVRTLDIAQSSSSAGKIKFSLVGTDASAHIITRERDVLSRRIHQGTRGMPCGGNACCGHCVTCTYHHGNLDSALYIFEEKGADMEEAVSARRLSASHFVDGFSRVLIDCIAKPIVSDTGLSSRMCVSKDSVHKRRRAGIREVGPSSPMDASLEELRQLIPFREASKGPKCSILCDAVEYIKKLRDRSHVLELQNQGLQNLVLPLDTAQSSNPASSIEVTVMGITATISIFITATSIFTLLEPGLTRVSTALADMHLHVVRAYSIDLADGRVLYRFYVTTVSTESMLKIKDATPMVGKMSALDILVPLNQLLLHVMATMDDVQAADVVRRRCSICLHEAEKVHSKDVSLQQLRLLITTKGDDESIVWEAIDYIRKLQYQIQLLELRNHELHNQAQSSSNSGKIEVTVVGTDASIEIITRGRPLVHIRASKVIAGLGLNVVRSSQNVTCTSHVDTDNLALYTFHVTSSKVKIEEGAAAKRPKRKAAMKMEGAAAKRLKKEASVKRLSSSRIVAALNRMLIELMEEEVK